MSSIHDTRRVRLLFSHILDQIYTELSEDIVYTITSITTILRKV